MDSLNVSLGSLELDDFDDFNVILLGKYAEFREHAKKPYAMKIVALSLPQTQILWKNFYSKFINVFPEAVNGYFFC